MAQDIVLTFGAPQGGWITGTPTSGWTFSAKELLSMNISTLSLQYVKVPVTATVNGVSINPTTDTVQLAFVAPGINPVSGDWKTASWETINGIFYARCLVGTGGAVALSAGQYQCWVRVTDNPEIVAQAVGVIGLI